MAQRKKKTKQEHRERWMLKQVEEIFESLEYPLFEKLEAADRIVARITAEAGACGVTLAVAREYIHARLVDMIDQIAEQREEADGRRNPRTKKAN